MEPTDTFQHSLTLGESGQFTPAVYNLPNPRYLLSKALQRPLPNKQKSGNSSKLFSVPALEESVGRISLFL